MIICLATTILTKHLHISLKDALEWVAIPFSRGSSWPRDWTQVSLNASQMSLPSEPPGKPFIIQTSSKFNMEM